MIRYTAQRFIRNRMRSFSILEVLIGSILFALIISSLFFWIRSSQAASSKVETRRREIEHLQDCQVILQRFLESAQITSTGFFFTTNDTDNQKLIFTCTNEVDPDPNYSNTVLISLWRDSNKKFIMTMWPDPESEAFDETRQRSCILLENVESLSWKFLTPTQQDGYYSQNATPSDLKEPGTWVNYWSHEMKQLPLAVSLQIKYGNLGTYPLTFILPSSSQPIVLER